MKKLLTISLLSALIALASCGPRISKTCKTNAKKAKKGQIGWTY